MPLSSCLLLNPLENSPPRVLWNALHQSHTNERHYTLQSVWFKDDLQSFPSAARNGNLPRDKLRIHLQYSKDIKRFKLCIWGVGVRTTNFHNRVRGLWVIMNPESMAAFMICSRACIHCMFRCSIVASTCHWSGADTNISSVCICRYPKCSRTRADNLFAFLASQINFPCAAIPNSKQ